MKDKRDNLIAGLTEELTPVRSFNPRDGALWLGLAVLATVLGVELAEGMWRGVLSGEPAPFFWVTNGLLLLLGLAASAAVITMASPSVGNRYDAPKWASAMLGVLPVTALIGLFSQAREPASLVDPSSMHCLTVSLTAALLSGLALTLWLRRGAPVSHTSAGWFTGIAAGALGTLVYGFSCTMDTVTHLGVWHVVPVAISAIVGRLIVPRLIAW